MSGVKLACGAAGGLAGGVLFGALMHMMGMIGMIGGLVGQPGAATGWVVHLAISLVLGLGFAVTLGNVKQGFGPAAGLGLVYGLVWWILGPLLIMPAMMGMPLLQVNQQSLMSLMGHLAYGLALGLVFTAVAQGAKDRETATT